MAGGVVTDGAGVFGISTRGGDGGGVTDGFVASVRGIGDVAGSAVAFAVS
ncbi:MAG: hypothetical protein ABW171_00265 [Steroidobacter sp.]